MLNIKLNTKILTNDTSLSNCYDFGCDFPAGPGGDAKNVDRTHFGHPSQGKNMIYTPNPKRQYGGFPFAGTAPLRNQVRGKAARAPGSNPQPGLAGGEK